MGTNEVNSVREEKIISNVLHESPFASVSTGGKGHPSLVSTYPSARQLNSDSGRSSPPFSLYRGRVYVFIAGRGVGMEPNHATAKKHGFLVFVHAYIHVLCIVYLQNYSIQGSQGSGMLVT
jgi:hypothetical protein